MTETHKAAVEALERIIGEGELGEDDMHHDNDTAKIFFFDNHYRTILKALRTLQHPSSVEVTVKPQMLAMLMENIRAAYDKPTCGDFDEYFAKSFQNYLSNNNLRITRAAATDGVK